MIKNRASVTLILLMMANLMVKVFGLLREVLLANFYGAGMYTDAYIIANNIPTVLFAALGSALTTSFVPMYTKIKKTEGEKRANSFTLHLLVAICIICLVVICFGELFTEQIVLLFASGFQGNALETTVFFSKILFPSILGIALMNLFGAYLQTHESFLAVVLVPMVGNITIVIALLLSNIIGDINILVWGTVAGLMAQVLFYIPWVCKAGIKGGTFKGFFSDTYLIQLLPLVLPVFLGEAVNEINSIVDRTLVSGLEMGSVSALNYAYKIIGIMTSVVCGSMTTLIYPKLSRLFVSKNCKEFQIKGEDSLSVIIIIFCPITVGMIVFGEDIVRLLFGRGDFDEMAVTKTSIALTCYAFAILGIGVRDIMVKIFCSMQDTKTPMINGTICAGVNIFLDFILVKLWGYQGAALATALAASLGAFNMVYIAKRRNIIRLTRFLPDTFKCMIGSYLVFLLLTIAHGFVQNVCSFGIKYIMFCGLIILGAIIVYFITQMILRNRILLYLLKK